MKRFFSCKSLSYMHLAAPLLLAAAVLGQPLVASAGDRIAPTMTDMAYGPFESNTLDFWQAPSAAPTPLIVYFHGGGFYEGDKKEFWREDEDITRCMNQGISLVSVNYRFIEEASLPEILRDCARAIQFMRYHAEDWNIDKARIAAFGESAGAGTSLWLAFHDDLADPNSADPVLRESTRLLSAGAIDPQSTYDFTQWPSILHIPEAIWYVATWYVSPAYYHLNVWRTYLPQGRELRSDVDLLAEVDPQDPPVYFCAKQDSFDIKWTNFGRWAYGWIKENITGERYRVDPSMNVDILHHPNHVKALERACEQQGVPHVACYHETPKDQRVDVVDFLMDTIEKSNNTVVATR